MERTSNSNFDPLKLAIVSRKLLHEIITGEKFSARLNEI